MHQDKIKDNTCHFFSYLICLLSKEYAVGRTAVPRVGRVVGRRGGAQQSARVARDLLVRHALPLVLQNENIVALEFWIIHLRG
jgi:hypothetical protein